MKLDFFDTEDRPYYAAIVWIDNGYGVERDYTTLQEARAALKRLRKKYPNCADSYILQYDEDGWCVRDYNE